MKYEYIAERPTSSALPPWSKQLRLATPCLRGFNCDSTDRCCNSLVNFYTDIDRHILLIIHMSRQIIIIIETDIQIYLTIITTMNYFKLHLFNLLKQFDLRLNMIILLSISDSKK